MKIVLIRIEVEVQSGKVLVLNARLKEVLRRLRKSFKKPRQRKVIAQHEYGEPRPKMGQLLDVRV